MIATRELRIGNKFNYHDQEVSVVLIGLTYAEFGYFTDSVGFRRRYDDKDFPKPIPLTKEWLERMGFNLFEGMFIKTKKGGQQVMIEQTTNGFKFDYGQGDNFAFLKSVHQLMNLYYSLTGTELTIQPH